MWRPVKGRDRQKVIGYVLVAVIILGLIYLVYWATTEETRPRYQGLEKLRGHMPPEPPPSGPSVLSEDGKAWACTTERGLGVVPDKDSQNLL